MVEENFKRVTTEAEPTAKHCPFSKYRSRLLIEHIIDQIPTMKGTDQRMDADFVNKDLAELGLDPAKVKESDGRYFL